MKIKTTKQIRSKLIPSVSETEANIYWQKKWVAVDDMIEWIKSRQINGSMCIAKTEFLKGQKSGELMMLKKMYKELQAKP